MLIIEYPNVTVKCRTVIKVFSLYFNLCGSVILVYSFPFLLFNKGVLDTTLCDKVCQ
jgi:hypothetical protein